MKIELTLTRKDIESAIMEYIDGHIAEDLDSYIIELPNNINVKSGLLLTLVEKPKADTECECGDFSPFGNQHICDCPQCRGEV